MPDISGDPVLLLIFVLTFLVAGNIKGVLGIGLPATSMAILTLVMEPTKAISIVALPIIVTNLQQFFSSRNRLQTARSYSWIAGALVVSIFLTALFIKRVPESFLIIAIGVVMCVFAMHSLSGFRVPMGDGRWWQTGVGLAAGICGGLSAIWAPPIVMYLISRNVSRDQFVAACGFLFMIGSFPLAAGLIIAGVLDGQTLVLSLIGTAIAVATFRFGASLRARLANDTFRKIVLVAFLLMGMRLVMTGATG
jgi:uncharacterized protein